MYMYSFESVPTFQTQCHVDCIYAIHVIIQFSSARNYMVPGNLC